MDELATSSASTSAAIKSGEEHESQPSVMREYLESKEFYWPDNTKHLEVGKDSEPPLKAERLKSEPLKSEPLKSEPQSPTGVDELGRKGNVIFKGQTTKVSSYSYDAEPPNSFKGLVAVKTFIAANLDQSNKQARKEMNGMTALYHPHVAALLATYTEDERFNIVIFPLASCSLLDYMEHICKQVGKTNSTMQSNMRGIQDSPEAIELSDLLTQSPQFGPQNRLDRSSWRKVPVNIHLFKLKSFFFCLCTALKYIHGQGVRHKDIKPANVLVDGSLSPILADFGLAACFGQGEAHVTRDGPAGTLEYAAPETAPAAKSRDHDDPTDVFSLGCVFLEMATVLLGKTLADFKVGRMTLLPFECSEYSQNLPKVYEWIAMLKTKCENGRTDVSVVERPTTPGSNGALLDALATIREMLDRESGQRPLSTDLPEKFAKVSAATCQDCNGRRPWKPNSKQEKAQQERRKGPRREQRLASLREHPCQESGSLTIPPRITVVSSLDDSLLLAKNSTESKPESVGTSISTNSTQPTESCILEKVSPRPRAPGSGDSVYVVDPAADYNGLMNFSTIQAKTYDVYMLPPQCRGFVPPGDFPADITIVHVPKELRKARFPRLKERNIVKHVYFIPKP